MMKVTTLCQYKTNKKIAKLPVHFGQQGLSPLIHGLSQIVCVQDMVCDGPHEHRVHFLGSHSSPTLNVTFPT